MARKTRNNVGVIGLGIIGSRVAAALRHGGFHVFVWNRSPRAEPNFLGSPSELAEVCPVIQLFVPDADAVFGTIEQISPKLGENHTILCSATIGPEATREAARKVEATGAKFLDAPFTGSAGAAEKRELVYYIGGDDGVLQESEPVLKASSKAIVKIGEIGDAATLKVVTNMLGAATIQTLAETFAIVRGSGIDPAVYAKALEHHGARSGLIDLKLPKITNGDYEPHFTIKNMFKDLQLGLKLAHSLDLEVPASAATAAIMADAMERGWSELDYAAVAKFYEKPIEKNSVEPQIAEPSAADVEPEQPEPESERQNTNEMTDEIPEEISQETRRQGGLAGWFKNRRSR
jgi:3-hydroxyisobutyrate dehydrogenase-like beta-hydroxyacid dehydrogenase